MGARRHNYLATSAAQHRNIVICRNILEWFWYYISISVEMNAQCVSFFHFSKSSACLSVASLGCIHNSISTVLAVNLWMQSCTADTSPVHCCTHTSLLSALTDTDTRRTLLSWLSWLGDRLPGSWQKNCISSSFWFWILIYSSNTSVRMSGT